MFVYRCLLTILIGYHYYILSTIIIKYILSSNSNESGSFSTDGLTQSGTTNSTFVQCTSTHLTSFAVLVDTSGTSAVSLTIYHKRNVNSPINYS